MSTFSDLNLNVTNLQEKQIDQLVEHAIKLGYDNLALAVDYEFPSTTSQNKPEQQGNKKNKKDASNKPVINIPLAKSYKLPQALQDRLNSCSRKIKIYSRITVKIKPGDINTCLHHLKSKPVLSYDLIALEPLDNQVLLYLCTNNFNADIISINSGISCGLTDKHLMRPLKNALTSFSMRFELNYSPSITSSTERRDFIMAGRCLTFNTNSNGLIISSGCSQKIGLRGPYEILNIVKLFDIKDLSAHQIVRRTPHDIITNSFCRKHTSAGMVYFNDISDLKRLEKALLSLKEKCDEAATKSSTNSQSEDKQHDQNISNKRLKKE